MTQTRLLAIAIALTFFYNAFGQQSATYTSELVDFQKALSLYNSKQYLAAQSLFDKIQDLQMNHRCLSAHCAFPQKRHSGTNRDE